MRQLVTVFLPPLAVILAVAAFNSAMPDREAPPEPAGEAVAGPLAPEPTEALEEAKAPFVSPAPAESSPGAQVEESADTATARALLFSLRFAAEASDAAFPTLEVAEAARLMTRRPETASVFISALADASRELRAVLIHTFHRVEDNVLRTQLLDAYRESDPTLRRLNEILRDRESILATLEGHRNEDLLYDLLGRLGSPLLSDPGIRDALLVLARNDDDPKIRNRALSRMGRMPDEEVRALLLGILADPQRDITERQTAARTLLKRPGPDTLPVFLQIVEGCEPAPLLRFAALGLKTEGANPAVAEALLRLLLCEYADETARMNAATALSHTMRTAPAGTTLPLEKQLRSALTDLSRQETSHTVLVHAMGEVSRGLEGRFDDDLVGILRTRPEEEFRVLLIADPTLKRFLEAQ